MQINEEDMRIKSSWLKASIITFIGVPTFLLGLDLIISINPDNFYEHMAIALISIIQFLIIRKCAYKGDGNIYLTILLVPNICLSLAIFIIFLGVLFDPNSSMLNYSVFESVLLGISSIWWSICSIKLWKVNKKLRNARLYTSPEFLEASSYLREASDIAELGSRFSALVEKWPALASRLDGIYFERKLALKSEKR